MSGKTLRFDQTIRYEHEKELFDAMAELICRGDLIEKDLCRLGGVTCTHTLITRNHFPTEGYDLRMRFYVKKADRRTTWDEIYEAVNTIRPVPYSFV